METVRLPAERSRLRHFSQLGLWRLRKAVHRSKAFSYRPLDARETEIRVLDVLPGRKGDPLRCEIQHIPLHASNRPQYETISYCWGDLEDLTTAPVVLNGKRLLVPTSSILALQRMRFPDRTRTLWIDALCINQYDKEERAQQVATMGEIYRYSKGNLIHLGEDEPDAEDALLDVRAALDDLAREVSARPGFDPYKKANRYYSNYRFPPSVDYQLLIELYALPWFRYGILRDDQRRLLTQQ